MPEGFISVPFEGPYASIKKTLFCLKGHALSPVMQKFIAFMADTTDVPIKIPSPLIVEYEVWGRCHELLERGRAYAVCLVERRIKKELPLYAAGSLVVSLLIICIMD